MFTFFPIIFIIGLVLFLIGCDDDKGFLIIIGLSSIIFGLVAAITLYNSDDVVLSASIGGVSMVLASLGLLFLDKIVTKHETKTRNLYLGKEAVVTIATDLNRYGQIKLDAPITKNDSEIRAKSKILIPSGTRVRIIDKTSKYVVIVEAVEDAVDRV